MGGKNISTGYVLHLIHQYGYLGITLVLVLGIVGLPLPDETLLTGVGYLVYRGHLAYLPAVLSGILGAVAGITVSYMLGRMLGRPMVLVLGRYVRLSSGRLERVERYFARYGGITLLGGLFIPGVRHVTAIVAGLAGMSYTRFAVSAYTGACLWVIFFITLGRFVGPHLRLLEQMLTERMVVVGGGAIVLALVVTGIRARLLRARRKREVR